MRQVKFLCILMSCLFLLATGFTSGALGDKVIKYDGYAELPDEDSNSFWNDGGGPYIDLGAPGGTEIIFISGFRTTQVTWREANSNADGLLRAIEGQV